MNTLAPVRTKVGRKKKDVPSDYVNVKIPRDVYLNLKLVATHTRREMAQVIGDVARQPLAEMAAEAFLAANPTKKAGPK